MTSIIAVFENYWGKNFETAIAQATEEQISLFGDEVVRFYDSFDPKPAPEKDLRIYSGGWAAANPSVGQFRTYLLNELLYADSIIVPDLTAIWFYPHPKQFPILPAIVYPSGDIVDQAETTMWNLYNYANLKANLPVFKARLLKWLKTILELRPLIEAGIVLPISQPHIVARCSGELKDITKTCMDDEAFLNICRLSRDEPYPIWDGMRGFQMVPTDDDVRTWCTALKARAREAAFHTAKNIAIAYACDATYVPSNETDYWLLAALVGQEDALARSSPRLSLHVPLVRDLTPERLLQIREDVNGFDDFRRLLRGILEQGGRESNDFARAQEWIDEEVARVASATKASNILQSYVQREGTGLILLEIAMTIGLAGNYKTGLAISSARFLLSILKRFRASRAESNSVLLAISKFRASSPPLGPSYLADTPGPATVPPGEVCLSNGRKFRIGNPALDGSYVRRQDSKY